MHAHGFANPGTDFWHWALCPICTARWESFKREARSIRLRWPTLAGKHNILICDVEPGHRRRFARLARELDGVRSLSEHRRGPALWLVPAHVWRALVKDP